MIAGHTHTDGTPEAVAAGALWLAAVNTPAAVVSEVLVYADGLGGSAGAQQLRPVVYQSDKLVHAGPAATISAGRAPGWVHLPLAGAARIDGGTLVGVHAGSTSGVVRLLVADDGERVEATAPFSAGAPVDLDGETVEGAAAVCASVLDAWRPPAIPDLELARLPWGRAQRGLAGAAVGEARRAIVGWHHLEVDRETGAVAVIRSGGPLADLVGERLEVSAGGRTVTVYAHTEQRFDVDEDMSLSRRAFHALAPLWTDALAVSVRVVV